MSQNVSSRLEPLKIALVGNPNCGKSTLFNALTGMNQKTGNYPGVTVEKRTGVFKGQDPRDGRVQWFMLIDLPGTYSLFPKSPDEEVTFEVLLKEDGIEYPDIILIVTDASNIKRHLLLATELIDLGRPCILILNMIDAAIRNGIVINAEDLERSLKIPVVSCNARQGEGIAAVKDKLFSFAGKVFIREPIINLSVIANRNYIGSVHQFVGQTSEYASLLKHKQYTHKNANLKLYNEKFFTGFENRDMLFRFEKIKKIILTSVQYSASRKDLETTDQLDRIITHPIWGFAIFLGILFIIFQSIFFLAEFPMQWIESFFNWTMQNVSQGLPQGMWNSMIVNGLLAGLSGIMVFIPQIALLFGFICLLEDSGYMARVSFIMDKIMRKVGLNGRSVIPLISGMACAVPSIMGARTIANARERLITILITPLMSCSARLPVYTVLLGLLIPGGGSGALLNMKGIWLTGLYLMGILVAMITALILKYVLKKKEQSVFLMELPVYRIPQIKTVMLTMFTKSKVFLFEAGKIIMVISIILWFLTTSGPGERMDNIEKERTTAMARPISQDEKHLLETRFQSEKLEASYAGHLGKWIEPAILPLGFDWKIGISLITSFAAREVFVGTMATLYGTSGDGGPVSIRQKMREAIDPKTGKPQYTPAVCVSLILFYAFAMQCVSTFAVVKRETLSWKWPLLQFFYLGVLAYLASWLSYTILS